MKANTSLRFRLPLDPAQNPYLDERRNYDPNLPKRKPRPAVAKASLPVIAATTFNASVNESPKGNFKEKQRANQEKRWEVLKSLNPDLIKQRGRMAKLNEPDETLFHVNAVRLDGQLADSTYEHAHRVDWDDKRWIKALNRWRSRRIYFWIGPVNRRGQPAKEGIPFTDVEKQYLRSFTEGYMGERISSGDWVVVTAFFNGQVAGGRKRRTKQLQGLRDTLDIEDLEA